MSALERALNEYRSASLHTRLNIMTDFFERTLPALVEEEKRTEVEYGRDSDPNPQRTVTT